MDQFLSTDDVSDPKALIDEVIQWAEGKSEIKKFQEGKHIGLVFFNSSLRTRLSTVKAARLLGMDVSVVNIGTDSWTIELNDGVVMNEGKTEHIKDLANMLGLYCDVIGVRCFASLENKQEDLQEKVLHAMVKYSSAPVVNLESSLRHPLQSLADCAVMEKKKSGKKKIALVWAPHVKPLPQAVPNSFLEWSSFLDAEITIAHPKGYELDSVFTQGHQVINDLDKAIVDADFVYVKSWCMSSPYGKLQVPENDWMLSLDRWKGSSAGVMHCLPVRRNLEVADDLLDSSFSLIKDQAAYRVWSAFTVLKNLKL